MSSIGRKMPVDRGSPRVGYLGLILALGLPWAALLADNQYLPEMAPQSYAREGSNDPSFFLSNTLKDAGKLVGPGEKAALLGDFSSSERYLQHSNRDIIHGASLKSRSRLTFYFIRNTFEYQNSAGNFERIYRKSRQATPSGVLLIAHDYQHRLGFLSLLWGLGTGLGYHGGKGVFVGADLGQDDTYNLRAQFNFYHIPLELRLGWEVPLGRYLALSALLGPGALGIIEYRSDRKDGDRDKYHSQVGWGYFGNLSLKFIVGAMLDDVGLKLYARDSVSRFSVNLEMRTLRYLGFKYLDSGELTNGDRRLVVSGTSYGVGLSYDF